jgi:creatinine amidohydrolase/Fe(II)-dependent formamide hydrolase-like protein
MMTNFPFRSRARLLAIFILSGLSVGAPASAAAPPASLHIEDMTWTELRDRIKAGTTTILVPIGGTEQNGPHMVLGKHNVRARVLATRIAQRLGNAAVAPVMAYVPEGAIAPPAAHMRFAGTVSISDAAFESVLESTARSFCQHGFRDVVFLGDHGGYQTSEVRVAAKLNREWAAQPACRVHALVDYYRATQGAYVDGLKARGFSAEEIGTHAGLADTALALAVEPTLVRQDLLGQSAKPLAKDGVYGDPRRATAELGKPGIDAIVETSVTQIKALTRPR